MQLEVFISRGVCVTCDEHHPAVHWQQLSSSVHYTDQDEAADNEEEPVDNWRKNKIQRDHKCRDPEPCAAVPPESPYQGGGEDGYSSNTEAGTGFHFQARFRFSL